MLCLLHNFLLLLKVVGGDPGADVRLRLTGWGTKLPYAANYLQREFKDYNEKAADKEQCKDGFSEKPASGGATSFLIPFAIN